ncbi:galactokinase [Paramagnetospirillum caucaseum]|uniref:Galactokinase n=1 Tax=Paramagnetospirillum caucaseum TaxID=1244869 RepID=M2ZAX5_9PROT|nr:galactokinase [Paramagnetospirillum caucaseum]EME71555.1 galactokinase [Paramagnetospirillum caucaseum]
MSFVVTKTPFRVSFFGGGTDYPAWYLANGGAVLSSAIRQYCYITCRYFPPYFPHMHRIVWSHIEVVQSIGEILHPAVRAALPVYGFDDRRGVEIHHQGDLPARTGIGSSSSFAVGLIQALKAMRGEAIGKHELALAAIDLERNVLGEAGGYQDQVAAAYGGLNVIRFNTDGSIRVEPLGLSAERQAALEGRLMLFYTGMNRFSAELARKIIGNMEAKNDRLRRMHAMVDEAAAILRHGDLDDFGRMLDETWRLKRGLESGITTSVVDEVYEKAMAAGALGGKLLGAGGAGFMVFYVPEGAADAVRRALGSLIHVPFEIDEEGARAIEDGRA